MTADPDRLVPPLFLAHGSPMLAITDMPARRFLGDLGRSLPRPRGIVILSPHWETDGLRVSAPGPLRTIHDFGNFPRALFEIQYPASAPRDLVAEVVGLFDQAGLNPRLDDGWGLDHGAWVPLSLLYPDADVPVVAVSLPLQAGPRDVLALGRALEPLTRRGVLVVGSGSTTHNLRTLQPSGTPTAGWAQDFDRWLEEGIAAGDVDRLARLDDAPHFRLAHPTEEHLLPVFFPLGAAGADAAGELLHRSYDRGTLSMTYYRFVVPETVS
ncbi:dioxygenase [Polymorphum gilvum]|uniref:Catalytic LigB subunit of aromatic ring-opening dioxygenase superfamily n=1 Tax=Polymorphum gilvum (strain LMG 25793 / CGMCC 1.9160 / SL003B-26A1) TaxID=991905 RepID=F2IYG9_POLGS|nr:class III extradiol ring-cleavage dioxygenase [Polymorphum gilvum]ADZ68482.1 Catalytic LigB subunit of aromatic ring-opening dioxygenase superfamily [Polymorphum gilvum SL003B-26A1]